MIHVKERVSWHLIRCWPATKEEGIGVPALWHQGKSDYAHSSKLLCFEL